MLKRGANCRDENGRWDIVSGRLEPGLTVEDNMRKEVREELGCEALNLAFLGYRDVSRPGLPDCLALDFAVLISMSSAHNAEPDMHDELRWVDRYSIPAQLHSQFEIFVNKYRNQLWQV